MTFLTIVIPLDLLDLGVVSAQTRSAFVVTENRRPQGPSGLLGPDGRGFYAGSVRNMRDL